MSPIRPRRLVISAGEPAGIGPDICLMLAGGELPVEVVVVSDPLVLEARARQLGLRIELDTFDRALPRTGRHTPGRLPVLPIQFAARDCVGRTDVRNAQALLHGLRVATQLTESGVFDALVTGPLQKSAINDAGIAFSGHTEYLAELTGADLPVMLLTSGELRVALASTHLPLAAVPAYLTADRLRRVLTVLHNDLTRRYRMSTPRIVVCGLNPHAGENGHLGTEERDIIGPVVAALRDQGMNLVGPVSADTAFTPAAGPADAVLAMFHDQGLPVIKYASFGHAVNVTLGLPIVRTSVDHGTALALAGTGKADPGSLRAAIDEACRLIADD